jgi:hypothetical protein
MLELRDFVNIADIVRHLISECHGVWRLFVSPALWKFDAMHQELSRSHSEAL